MLTEISSKLMREYTERENTTNRVGMTPEEQQKIKRNLQEIADILYKNTPPEKLQDFESVELNQA